MRKLVLLLVGFVLVVAACGTGDEEPTETEPTTETGDIVADTTTQPTVTPADDAMPDDAMADDAMPDDAMADDAMTDDATTDDGAAQSPPTTEPEPEPIDAVVTLRALGPVRIGMTVEEAAGEAGVELRRDFGRQSTSSCYYVTAGAALRGVSIMVVDDQIARIDIDSPSTIGTRSGVRIGTAVGDLREVYPNNIRQANDAVAEGEAMAFVPNDDFDADYRIYFEIEDGQVARYRLGTKPAGRLPRRLPRSIVVSGQWSVVRCQTSHQPLNAVPVYVFGR